MKVEVKRGYVKWTDENGVKHKVRESEYVAPTLELNFEVDDDEETSDI